jgi:hypothetical protein
VTGVEGEEGDGDEGVPHASSLSRNVAIRAGALDDSPMRTLERRRRRTNLITQALTYQLSACCEDGKMQAMVVADEDGLPLASSGDRQACDEVAASMVHIGARAPGFCGTLLRLGQCWDVEMTQVVVDGSPLLVCAIGGSAEQRRRQLARGAKGALRILASTGTA